MQTSHSHVIPSIVPAQPHSSNRIDGVGHTVSSFLVIFFPSCLILGVILYKKYRAHRAETLRRQIEALELMWRISPKK